MDMLHRSRANDGTTTSHSAPRSALRLALLGAALAGPGVAGAAVITDSNFFDPYPTTLIDFETDGSGNQIILIPGETRVMPSEEYITKGVAFNSPYWVFDGNAAFQAALLVGGSPEIAIPSSLVNEFEMTFTGTGPVLAFGYWVVNNRRVDAAGPQFVAFNSENEVIGTAQFGPAFIDGTITSPSTTADYGFMGILTEEPIARVVITKQAAILDDLHFSPVPAPGTIALAGLGGLMIFRRHRHR